MKVRWTPEAEQDRTAIWDYLAVRAPDAALRIDQRSALRSPDWLTPPSPRHPRTDPA
uniref:type II toxin-antitoxin system RelE/ParE family toxin n=1 Tax=Sphingomonas populi TaxID=2484750 RepID=UPI001E442F3D|nr:type II toxin-antitoxin system RelE/ParE family toxin [Sphingomonas populi]